jgi:hypothetical protein
MRAPEVWQALTNVMEGDAVIAGIVNGAVTLSDGEKQLAVPSITGTLIPAQQGERFVAMTWQIDAFAKSMADAVTLGERLLALFDHDVRKEIGGLLMWIRCSDEREFHGPVDDGVYRRSLDFEVEVIRRRYVRGGES